MDAKKFIASPFGEAGIAISSVNFTAYFPKEIPRNINLNSETSKLLSIADNSLGQLEGLGSLINDPELLYVPFMIKEILFSSRIEGTKASLPEIFLATDTEQTTSLSTDLLEMRQYLIATSYAISELKNLPISQRLITATHEKLMDKVRGQEKNPGKFRSSPVWIGSPGVTLSNADFVPPVPEEIPQLMTDWENYVNNFKEAPVLIKAAIAHYQFETIHPFLDGNGRIGRLIVLLILLQEKALSSPLLYLSGYLEKHRDEYYATLQNVREKGEIQEYLQFFLKGVATQAQDAKIKARKILDLEKKYFKQVEADRSKIATLIPIIFKNPYLSSNSVEKYYQDQQYSITRSGIHGLLTRAEELKWITKTKQRIGRGGKIIYLAEDILNILVENTLLDVQ